MSVIEYRARQQKFALDGSPIFTTTEDTDREKWVAEIISERWRCELLHLGIYSLIDYWACRNGQPVGWVEIKGRDYDGETYATELLNVRKWITLVHMSTMTPWPAVFVSATRDTSSGRRIVRYLPVMEIEARADSSWRVIAPRGGVVKSRNDIEPCILIQHAAMRLLHDDAEIK